MLNTNFILINFLDEWISVDPRTIQIDNFKFPNIEDTHFATFLIEDKNGAHNALKRAVSQCKIQNDLDHQALTSFGSLTIYQSGRPMKFIQN